VARTGQGNCLFLGKQRQREARAHRYSRSEAAVRIFQPQVEQQRQQVEEGEFEIGHPGNPRDGLRMNRMQREQPRRNQRDSLSAQAAQNKEKQAGQSKRGARYSPSGN